MIQCFMPDGLKAVAFAPQLAIEPLYAQVTVFAEAAWRYLPVCHDHADTWWDGSDIPEAERPPIEWVVSLSLFTPYFLRRTPGQQYDLLSFLRSSDMPQTPHDLKREVTGRVRAIVLTRGPGNGDFYKGEPLTAAGASDVTSAIEASARWWHSAGQQRVACTPRHYLYHMRAALAASADHSIWNGHVHSLIDALNHHGALA